MSHPDRVNLAATILVIVGAAVAVILAALAAG